MTHGLANIFVNNQRVEDLDNPELRIRDIIQAYGRDPERCIVYRLESEDETEAARVDLNERVDLAAIRGALYLRCETRRTEATAPSPQGATSGHAEEEGFVEFEEVPDYEGVEEPFPPPMKDAAFREESHRSAAEAAHASGDPSGHASSEHDAAPPWERPNQQSIEPAERRPSALGSELRSGKPPPDRPSRRRPRLRGGRAPKSTASTPSMRTSRARRKNKQESGPRRSRQ